ncbi:hypothetical protein GW17_00057052, partial [Ensete ventricosum]
MSHPHHLTLQQKQLPDAPLPYHQNDITDLFLAVLLSTCDKAMGEKKAALPGRAWRLLRMALLWARKGGVFKRGIFVNLRIVPGYLKSLKPGG